MSRTPSFALIFVALLISISLLTSPVHGQTKKQAANSTLAPMVNKSAKRDFKLIAMNLLQDPKGVQKGDKVKSKSQSDKSEKGKATQNTKAKKPLPMSEERLKELTEFVKEHHAELLAPMDWLKKKRPVQYQSVLRSMDRTVVRLQAWKERDEKKYEFGLKQWKLRSRVQLLSAKLAIQDTPKLRKELTQLIGKDVDLRVEQLKREAEQMRARLKKLDKQIETMTSKRKDEVARQMELVIKSADKAKAARQKAKKQVKDKPEK